MNTANRNCHKKSHRIIADFTLNDFANCSAHTERWRKPAGSHLYEEVDNIRFFQDHRSERFPSTQIHRKQIKPKAIPVDFNGRPGIQYPIDTWFLIGQYIKPEDVKVFACICKGSHSVSISYPFWKGMFNRYIQKSAKLPQPESMAGSLRLKVNVIRALYHIYPIFTTQLSRLTSEDVYALQNFYCKAMWHIRKNSKWLFYFKFQMATHLQTTASPVKSLAIQKMWAKQDEDEGVNITQLSVIYNPDEGCKILRITCEYFMVVSQSVMGKKLTDVHINLAHDMCCQKVKLTFFGGNIVEFDLVENILVLNWWHPEYPLL